MPYNAPARQSRKGSQPAKVGSDPQNSVSQRGKYHSENYSVPLKNSVGARPKKQGFQRAKNSSV